jgi:hypothetical protein
MTPIHRAAEQLAHGLGQQFVLSGSIIQISANNFWKRGSHMNLPFSDALSEALAVSISQAGAAVTVQEFGYQPLRLVGSYDWENGAWVITVRIRQMGENASQDLAITRASMPRKDLDPRWMQPGFQRVARTLIRMLEDNYVGFEPIDIQLTPLVPGINNQPSVRLGHEFRKYLAQAAAASPMLKCISHDASGTSHQLTGTYTQTKDQIRFDLRVFTPQKILLSSAAYDIPKSSIPSDFWRLYASSPAEICVVYRQSSTGSPSTASMAAQTLRHRLSAILSSVGLDVRPCDSGQQFTPRLEASLRLRQRQTADGFRLMFADLQLKSIHQAGRILGIITERDKNLFQDDPEAASLQLVNRMLDRPDLVEQLVHQTLRP